MPTPLSLSVVWSEDAGPSRPGRLDVGGSLLALSGGSRTEPVALEVPVADLRSVRIGRSAAERLGDRATVLLDLHDGRRISIASVATVGVLYELVERLHAAVAAAG